jgi:hypothetical protein
MAHTDPRISLDKIARMLHRRPPQGRFREQLFWLVDLIYACKSSGDNALAAEAQLVEDALGLLGEFLETGDRDALERATARVEQFANAVRIATKHNKGSEE